MIDLTTIFIGIFCSLVAVGLISIFQKRALWRKFKPLMGNYKGYTLAGTEFDDHPEFKAVYKFWKKKLILQQLSEERGNWESHLHIISEIPYNSTGVFRYDKKGKYADNWGIHEVTINFEEQIFHVKAHGKNTENNAEYILKKG